MSIPWKRYQLEIHVDRLVGGIPANPRLMDAWLEKNGAPSGAAEDQKAMIERLDVTETHAVVFYRAQDGTPCYESRNMKAALKESANILKGVLDVRNFRAKLAERVFVGPLLVPMDPASLRFAERPISVMTMQGPRTSIKRYEYAENVPLAFSIKVLDDGVVTEEHLRDLVEYLQDNGIGADRSQGAGTFSVVRFEAVQPAAVR